MEQFDAIVVGARIAGSATALRLARRGWRVLLLDAARFPSDTLSTHLLWSDALAAFDRLGLLPAVLATDAPPLAYTRLIYGALCNEAPLPTRGGYPPLLSVRRIVLDDLLVARARATPGITLREGVSLSELLWEDGAVVGVRGDVRRGERETFRGRIVIGADGRHSIVARLVGAATYDTVPPLLATYYAYFRDVAPNDPPLLEVYRDAERGYGYLFPCDGGLWTLALSFPQARFAAVRRDHERGLAEQLARKPALAARLARATRIGPWRGAGDLVNFFRVPGGRGWALVGDAGYHRDPITARGIPDALHGAELLAGALAAVFQGQRQLSDALVEYQATRDALVRPLYDFTRDRPPPGVAAGEWERYLARVLTDPAHLSAFMGFMAGAVASRDFYSAAAVQRVLATTGA